MVQGDEKVDEIYYEIARDDVSHRNIIIPRSRIGSYLGLGKVVYRSMYGFKNTIIDHFKIYRSVKSFKDICYIENLVFDIDTHDIPKELRGEEAKEALIKALKEGTFKVKELIRQIADMTGVSEYSVPIWYSGRGFHLQTPDFFHFKPSTYLRDEVLSTMKHFFPYIDHKPYMSSGLIRLNYSYNDKTETYKIPIHYSELSDMASVIEKAKTPYGTDGKYHKVQWEEWDAYDLSDRIIVPAEKASHEVNKFNVTRVVTCVQKMYKAGPIVGSRNNTLLRMLSAWRKMGLTYEQSFILAKEWFKGEWTDYQINVQVNFIWANRYKQYNCQDEIMSKFCDYNCIYYKSKNYNVTVSDNMTIEQELKKEMELNDELGFDLAHIFNLSVPCEFKIGNSILLMGHPKIGKSFWMQFITQKAKKKTLYYTLEMPATETYIRQLMIALEETEEQVRNRLLINKEELYHNVDHITFIDQSPTLLDIQSHIEQYEPEWIVIDTIDMVSEDQYKGNETMKLTYLFQKFKQMAMDNKLVILIVQHIVDGLDKDGKVKPLTMFSGLYSKEGARKCDRILGWEGYHESPKRKLKSLALRRGKHFEKFVYYQEDLSTLIPE